MSRVSASPPACAGDSKLREGSARRPWLFAALTLGGIILILISFALLLRGLTAGIPAEISVRL
jgi:hypothetical protein